MKHLNIRIFGRVQGVFFRDSAKREADKLNILGFIWNESDGSVYIEAEGEEKALAEFVEWCKNGPRFAKVFRVDVENGITRGFNCFRVE